MSEVTALIPYFGSKRTLAPAIAAEIGPHTSYWEVPCGSMAVLLSMAPCRSETVVDLHGDLINLARVIQDATLGPAFYRRLRRVWSSEDEFRAALAVVRSGEPDPSAPDIGRALAYFVASWQGMNGVAGTATINTSFCKRFSDKGGAPGARWLAAVRSIPGWRRRMERVSIIRGDMFDILPKIDDAPGTAIYCDPPYLTKGAKYLHDFATSDHERLAAALSRFRSARVVVSYYDHPTLAGLYPGWSVRRLDVAKGLVNSGRRDESGATKAPEVLLVNGPLIGAEKPDMFDLFGATP